MTRSKSIIAALALCALSVCAFGAASASATGLTAVQCEKVSVGKYNNSHCTTPQVAGEYETNILSAGKHEVEGTDTRTKTAEEGGGHGLGETAKPTAIFHSTLAGVEVTVTCGKGNTTGGSVENVEVGGEMKIHTFSTNTEKGKGLVDTWSECHASPRTKPLKICTVQGIAPEQPVGSIATNNLTSTTGAEHKVTIKTERTKKEEEEKIEPPFTKFKVNASGGECFTTTAVEVTVTGEAWGRANTETHSHLTLDEASNSGSPLRANGNVASQTETVTGFTKGNKELTVGAETF